jgi:hypothetical protein
MPAVDQIGFYLFCPPAPTKFTYEHSLVWTPLTPVANEKNLQSEKF